MLAELLKRWTELAPKECSTKDGEYFCLDIDDSEEIDSVFPDDGLPALQYAVLSAIVDRKLRCRIENAAAGWYAKIATTCDESKDALQHHDKECAVALLKAYVSYLEGQKAAAPT